jgi:drug/metabolite transporter (DMT)-like permease
MPEHPPSAPAGPTPGAAARSGAGAGGAIARMLGASILFTGMALCVVRAHAHQPGLSTLAVSFVRSLVNLVALGILVRGDRRMLLGDARPALVARGVFGALALGGYFASLERLSAGEAAFLNQTSAGWVALLAPVVLRERTGTTGWIAVGGSLLGVLLLAHPRGGHDDTLGRALGLGSGLAAAVAYLSIRRATQTNGPIAVVGWFTLVSTLLSGPALWLAGGDGPADPVSLAWLVGAGLCATWAQILMTRAYADGRAALVAAAGASSPMLTALAGWVWLGQRPDAAGALGMVVLFACGVVLPWWEDRRAR